MSKRYLKWLTPEEAIHAMDLDEKLRQARLNCLDYLLLRAAYTLDRGESSAWFSIYKLIQFVERKHRYPKKLEQAELFKEDFQFAEEVFITANEFSLAIEKDIRQLHTKYKDDE